MAKTNILRASTEKVLHEVAIINIITEKQCANIQDKHIKHDLLHSNLIKRGYDLFVQEDHEQSYIKYQHNEKIIVYEHDQAGQISII